VPEKPRVVLAPGNRAPNRDAGWRVAVVGGGIAGLGATWLIGRRHTVVLHEAENRLGGHARTVTVSLPGVGPTPVDTGFIVFNRVTYPHLCGLFDQLEVPVHKSAMSFGVSVDSGAIEYGSRDMRAFLAQPRNAVRPAFWRMVRDIAVFFRTALADTVQRPGMTVGELIERRHYGPWFEHHYLLPMSGAIWSTPESRMRDFPAAFLVRFFANHGLLSFRGQHQWWTVSGGSSCYVAKMAASLSAEIRTKTPVEAVRRTHNGIVLTAGGTEEVYDAIVLACHADTALAILKDATWEERRVLERVRFRANRIVLHTDTRMMPRRRACWSSWVALTRTAGDGGQATVSYWMNSLQGLPGSRAVIATLNPPPSLDPGSILDEITFSHPQYDRAALDAQAALPTINGRAGTWYCGAWTGNGFHEDGLASAVAVARQLDVTPPWM